MTNSTAESIDGSFSKFVGVVNSLVSVALIVIYLPCVYVILKQEKFYKLVSYKFILLMALFDMMQLLCLGPASAVFQLVIELQPKHSKIWGAMAIAGWLGYLACILLLAFERFFKVIKVGIWQLLYSGRRVYMWLATPIIFATGLFILMMGNAHRSMYDPSIYNWQYVEPPGRAIVETIDGLVSLVVPAIVSIVYTIIFVHLNKMSQTTTSGSSKHEHQILYQSFTVSSMIVALIIVWHTLPFVSTDPRSFWVSHLMWLVNAGLNGIIYMVFNKSLRDAVKHVILPPKVAPVIAAGSRMQPRASQCSIIYGNLTTRF